MKNKNKIKAQRAYFKYYLDNPGRQAGHTTRMLDSAADILRDGKRCAIITHSIDNAKRLRSLLNKRTSFFEYPKENLRVLSLSEYNRLKGLQQYILLFDNVALSALFEDVAWG